MKFNELIRWRRLDLGFTGRALADRIGCKEIDISNYEHGKRVPVKVTRILQLSKALELDLNRLIVSACNAKAIMRIKEMREAADAVDIVS